MSRYCSLLNINCAKNCSTWNTKRHDCWCQLWIKWVTVTFHLNTQICFLHSLFYTSTVVSLTYPESSLRSIPLRPRFRFPLSCPFYPWFSTAICTERHTGFNKNNVPYEYIPHNGGFVIYKYSLPVWISVPLQAESCRNYYHCSPQPSAQNTGKISSTMASRTQYCQRVFFSDNTNFYKTKNLKHPFQILK